MNLIEAKKILLAADLDPTVREAINVLSSDLDFQNLPGEEWRDVVGYEGYYQVSNLGRVRSFRHSKIKILNPDLSKAGYLRASLKSRKCFVHVLVAQAFIPNPEGKRQVNHISGDKANNRVENLEWVTPAENIHHAFETGLRKSGCEHFRAKFTAEQVREIRRDCVPGDPERGFKSFARKFNVTPKIIRDAFYGKSYQDVE